MDRKVHYLKTWPQFFQAVKSGEKPFELRQDDRNFQVGDILVLQEFDPSNDTYTLDEVRREITYKLNGGAMGLATYMCILGMREIP